MVLEIRNYHFNPALFTEYKEWARTGAVPYLSERLDVLGFWVATNDPPEVRGEPLDKIGAANVTWIIRWNDLAHRNKVLPRVLTSPEWKEIFSRVPGGSASYIRREARFAESLV